MRHLPRFAIATLSALGLVGVLYAAGGEKDPADKQPDCCGKLLSRIEALEARLQVLESRSPSVVVPERYSLPPQLDPKRLPPGTQEREFNGMKYYIIPLDQARTEPPPPDPRGRRPGFSKD